MRATRSACSGWSSTIRAIPIVVVLAVSRGWPRPPGLPESVEAASTPAGRPAGGGVDGSRDVELDDVGVVQLVVALDGLSLKDAGTPDPGRFQRMFEVPVDLPGQVQD